MVMEWEARITADPQILVGKPVIRGTRLSVEFILDLLTQGWSYNEILRNYPGIELIDILACLAYARATLYAKKKSTNCSQREKDHEIFSE